MTKVELQKFIKRLKEVYPDAVVKPEEWWRMFQKYQVNVLDDALAEWKTGQWGFRAPTVEDIRYTKQCCIWNPDGVFYKAMVRVTDKTDDTQKDVMEELRQ